MLHMYITIYIYISFHICKHMYISIYIYIIAGVGGHAVDRDARALERRVALPRLLHLHRL